MLDEVIVWGYAADFGKQGVKIVGAEIDLFGYICKLYLLSVMLFDKALCMHNYSAFVGACLLSTVCFVKQ